MRAMPLGALALFTMVLSLYLHGLHGGFLFDDFPNIVDNDSIRAVDGSLRRWLFATFSSDSGLLRRPVSMFSFALSYYLGGMNPAGFKLLNIAIHLVSGMLAYRLAILLLPSLITGQCKQALRTDYRLPALLVSSCWLLHPLHVSSVLYVVQRMNLLSSLFILAGLLCYAQGRVALLNSNKKWSLYLLGFFVFGCFAVLSKENGALLPLYALVIELFCFHFSGANSVQHKLLKLTYLVGLALPTLALITYWATHPSSLVNMYGERDFTLADRLFTQPRILWDYLLWTFAPNPHWMGLYHDDIPYSRGLLTPATTLPAILGLLGLVGLAVWWRRSRPAVSFAVAWFFAGHIMESTVLPLEMVFEHRHYLPMLGIILGFVSLAVPLREKSPALAAAISISIVAVLSIITAQRTWNWGDPLRIAISAAEDHPYSPRSLYDAGRALLSPQRAGQERKASLEHARQYFSQAMALKPTDINAATGLILSYQETPLVPVSLLNDFNQRLRVTPMLSPIPVMSLVRMSAGGSLPLKAEEVSNLVAAALENKSLSPLLRGLILSTYGYYLMDAAHDPNGAIGVTLTAIEFAPNFALFRLNAAYLAQRIGDKPHAMQQLEAAATLDAEQTYTKEIMELREKLAAQP